MSNSIPESDEKDVPLPWNEKFAVLVATGSFKPPTYMHLRIFDLARDALTGDGGVLFLSDNFKHPV